jgi:hypothetical protein
MWCGFAFSDDVFEWFIKRRLKNKGTVLHFMAMRFGGFSSLFQTIPAPYQFTRTALLPSRFSSSSNNAELGVTIHFGGT